MLLGDLDAGDFGNHVVQAIDGDEFGGTHIQRLTDIGVHQTNAAFDTVVDVHEAARLLAVAPDLDLVLAAALAWMHLAADGGRRLLAAAVPRAVGAVDVVEAGDPRLEAEVLAEVAAHALGNSFSQP